MSIASCPDHSENQSLQFIQLSGSRIFLQLLPQRNMRWPLKYCTKVNIRIILVGLTAIECNL